MEGHRPQRILRAQLGNQIDAAVHRAFRRESDAGQHALLRVFVSEDLLPAGQDEESWTESESARIQRVLASGRGGSGGPAGHPDVEVIVLDTKRSFTHARLVHASAPPAPVETPSTPPPPPTQETQRHAVIRFLPPHDMRQALVLSSNVVLGRADEEGVTGVHDDSVSRRHLGIRVRDGALVATDLGSKNGTLVNEDRLPAYANRILEVGDVLQIGAVRMKVEATGGEGGNGS